jgi:hypothetical protein
MKERLFMNPKIKKTRDELERTKAKIAEFQALVPQLERSITDMENTEIVRLVRSADIAPADLPAFIASLKNTGAGAQTPETPQMGGYNAETTETVLLKEEDEDDV